LYVKHNLTVKWGMLSQELGVIITHWKDVYLLIFPDAAFQEERDKKDSICYSYLSMIFGLGLK